MPREIAGAVNFSIETGGVEKGNVGKLLKILGNAQETLIGIKTWKGPGLIFRPKGERSGDESLIGKDS